MLFFSGGRSCFQSTAGMDSNFPGVDRLGIFLAVTYGGGVVGPGGLRSTHQLHHSPRLSVLGIPRGSLSFLLLQGLDQGSQSDIFLEQAVDFSVLFLLCFCFGDVEGVGLGRRLPHFVAVLSRHVIPVEGDLSVGISDWVVGLSPQVAERLFPEHGLDVVESPDQPTTPSPPRPPRPPSQSGKVRSVRCCL